MSAPTADLTYLAKLIQLPAELAVVRANVAEQRQTINEHSRRLAAIEESTEGTTEALAQLHQDVTKARAEIRRMAEAHARRETRMDNVEVILERLESWLRKVERAIAVIHRLIKVGACGSVAIVSATVGLLVVVVIYVAGFSVPASWLPSWVPAGGWLAPIVVFGIVAGIMARALWPVRGTVAELFGLRAPKEDENA